MELSESDDNSTYSGDSVKNRFDARDIIKVIILYAHWLQWIFKNL